MGTKVRSRNAAFLHWEKNLLFFSSGSRYGNLAGSLAAETATVLDVPVVRQVAAAATTGAADGIRSQAKAQLVLTLGSGNAGKGSSGLIHAANQLPANAAFLRCEKNLKNYGHQQKRLGPLRLD